MLKLLPVVWRSKTDFADGMLTLGVDCDKISKTNWRTRLKHQNYVAPAVGPHCAVNMLFGCTGVSPMLELMKYINLRKKPRARRAGVSLSGMLEAFIRNYYVDGEVEAVPFHVAAYVSSVYRWGFVLSRCIRKFSRNMSG